MRRTSSALLREVGPHSPGTGHHVGAASGFPSSASSTPAPSLPLGVLPVTTGSGTSTLRTASPGQFPSSRSGGGGGGGGGGAGPIPFGPFASPHQDDDTAPAGSRAAPPPTYGSFTYNKAVKGGTSGGRAGWAGSAGGVTPGVARHSFTADVQRIEEELHAALGQPDITSSQVRLVSCGRCSWSSRGDGGVGFVAASVVALPLIRLPRSRRSHGRCRCPSVNSDFGRFRVHSSPLLRVSRSFPDCWRASRRSTTVWCTVPGRRGPVPPCSTVIVPWLRSVVSPTMAHRLRVSSLKVISPAAGMEDRLRGCTRRCCVTWLS